MQYSHGEECGRKLQQNGRSSICVADLQEAFCVVPHRVNEFVTRKRNIPDVFVSALMNLYDGYVSRGRWSHM